MATTYDLVKYLSTNQVEFSLRTHESISSAHGRAQALRIPDQMVVQTKLIKVNGCCWMVATPAHRTVNFNSISRILDSNSIQACDLNDWNYYFPNCEINVIPPFGNLYGISVLADTSLEQGRHIVFGAYSSTQSIFMRWSSFASLVNPLVAAICDEVSLIDRQSVHRAVNYRQ